MKDIIDCPACGGNMEHDAQADRYVCDTCEQVVQITGRTPDGPQWSGTPIDFRKWWDSHDHTYKGDATPMAVAGLAWEAAHKKYGLEDSKSSFYPAKTTVARGELPDVDPNGVHHFHIEMKTVLGEGPTRTEIFMDGKKLLGCTAFKLVGTPLGVGIQMEFVGNITMTGDIPGNDVEVLVDPTANPLTDGTWR